MKPKPILSAIISVLKLRNLEDFQHIFKHHLHLACLLTKSNAKYLTLWKKKTVLSLLFDYVRYLQVTATYNVSLVWIAAVWMSITYQSFV